MSDNSQESPVTPPNLSESPKESEASPPSPTFPTAKYKQRRFTPGWFYLLIPGFVLLIVLFVLYWSWNERGDRIWIQFQEGYGLKPGDSVRCRGIIVGEVLSVELSSNLKTIDVVVDLRKSARGIAVEGSRFWIVRPQADLTGIAGLDTAIGGKYVAVLAGQGKPAHAFVGKETPQVELDLGGLQIIVQDRKLGGLRVGAPLTYRGVRIGTVLSSQLGSDASAVEMLVYVLPEHVRLVRTDSLFYNVSGLRMGGSLLSGRLGLDFESAETILTGGMALATPSKPGDLVQNGHRFDLSDQPPKELEKYNPSLPKIDTDRPSSIKWPPLLKVTLKYTIPGRFFGTRQAERTGIVLPIKGIGLLGFPEYLAIPADAVKSSVPAVLSFEGGSQTPTMSEPKEVIIQLQLSDEAMKSLPKDSLSRDRLRIPGKIEDCLLANDPGGKPLFVSATHMRIQGEKWVIQPSYPGVLPRSQWHGAAVLGQDGKIIGLLAIQENGMRSILPLNRDILREKE